MTVARATTAANTLEAMAPTRPVSAFCMPVPTFRPVVTNQILGCTMRTQLLAWSIVLGAASALPAQSWPGYPYGGAQPYGYPSQPLPTSPYYHGASAPPSTPVPTPTAPRVYYGDFPNAIPASPPPVMAPQPTYIPAQHGPGVSSDPVYYYPPANSYSPTPYHYFPYGQLGKPVPPPIPSKAVGWPNPTPRYVSHDFANDEPRAELQRLAALPFHRETRERFWLGAEYLASFMRPMRVAAPLLTTGSTFDAFPGAIGQPGTGVLYPTQNIDFGLQSGFKLHGGWFLDDCDRFSLELAMSFYGPNNTERSAAGDNTGRPFLSRPIFNVAAGREGAFLNTSDGTANVPAVILGTYNAEFKSLLMGIELNARHHTYWWERFHADTLVGFRYMHLSERMRIMERLTPSAASAPFLTFQGAVLGFPNEIADEDLFRTGNNFFGGQVGGRLSYEYRWINLEGSVKLALGVTRQQTRIEGSSSLISPAGITTVPGGVLAVPTNIGSHTRSVFGILPEFGVNASINVTQNIRVQLGYSFLMWNKVVRPGSQFDRNINPAQVPTSPTFGPFAGPISPTYRFNDELFYAHTFNIGLLFHY